MIVERLAVESDTSRGRWAAGVLTEKTSEMRSPMAHGGQAALA